MGKYKKREHSKKPETSGRKAPEQIQYEASAEAGGNEAVTGLQQLYGNRIVRSIASGAGQVRLDPQVTAHINTAKGRGNPLEKGLAEDMGAAFSRDFSDVRVHDDSESAGLAERLNARAFTAGNDIFIKDGTPGLHTQQGIDILSHELTHVVQQDGAAGNVQSLIDRPELEQQAEGHAAGVASHLDAVAVQRTEDPPLTERRMTAELADEQIRGRFGDFIRQYVDSEGRAPAAAGMIHVVDDAEFRRHYEEEYNTPEDQAAHPYEGINAFVDATGQAWVHSERGTVGTVVHEALHMYSQPEALEAAMGRNGKGGMTEYFTIRVCLRMDIERDYGEYREAAQCMENLADKAGDIWMLNAFFRGHIWALGHHIDMLMGVPHFWRVWCNLVRAGRFDDANRILEMDVDQLQETIGRLWGQMTNIENFLVPDY